jgi:hypothetical protein
MIWTASLEGWMSKGGGDSVEREPVSIFTEMS